jgi:hypothetical protein
MMRLLGVPARVVTGYQGGEINPVDGIMTIRQSDAHAWAEVWLAGRGWLRIDPTAAVAPDRIEVNLAQAIPRTTGLLGTSGNFDGLLSNESLLGQIRNQFQALNHAWGQWVLDYTPERQRNLFAALGFEQLDWAGMLKIALLCGAVVMGAILIPMIRQQQKRDPLDALYSRLEMKLAKRGLARLPHEGPSSWAQRLREHAPPSDAHAAIIQFLQVYTAQQYSNSRPANVLATLKSLLRQIR